MIVFLTLCYCSILFLLVKLKIIRLTLWWKLSPLVWLLLLLIVLFIPMQWGAPSGTVNVYQTVVEIIPNVSGEVVDVPVQGLVPLQVGDVLFRIDPVPYQAAVDRLEAELEGAKQGVLQLQASLQAASAAVTKAEEQIDVIKAEQEAAAANIAAAEAAEAEAGALRDKAAAVVTDLEAQFSFAESERDRIQALVAREAATPSQLDQAQVRVSGLQSTLTAARADVVAAEQSVARSRADVSAAQASAKTVDVRMQQAVDADLPMAQADEQAARLAAESTIEGVHTNVANVQAQLDNARYDLRETTVRAPSDGYVIGVTLRPGQRVANLPLRSWMAFVNTEKTKLAVGINQFVLRHVQPGQAAEVTFKLYPGRTIAAKVADIAYMSPGGQLQPAGEVPAAPSSSDPAVPFGVILELEEESFDISQLPGGAVGTAAIYTDRVTATHLIRRVMVRMQAWMNYVVPW